MLSERHRMSDIHSLVSNILIRFPPILKQGKSLSLICGALTWLRDYEEKQKKEVEQLLKGTNVPGFVISIPKRYF